ncbi:MAG: hypothetical protein LBH46_00770 [Rickettsiales bacterium]|jgi:hypothetical protein|nr:hypothetical protein [Rickettsiales bacterium]
MELLKNERTFKVFYELYKTFKNSQPKVLFHYINLQSIYGENFKTSLNDICKELNICKQTLIGINKFLLKNGLIEIKNDGEPTSTNSYTVDIEKVFNFVPTKGGI